MLKKTTVLAAAIAAALMLGACSKSDSSQAAASAPAAEKAYVVATDATYAPFEYLDNNQVVGFSKDILDAIAANQGIKFDFANTPWEGIFATLGKGDSDIVSSSVTITDERKGQMDFSDPYFEASQLIVTNEKGSGIQSFADLKNHTASVQTGTPAIWCCKSSRAPPAPTSNASTPCLWRLKSCSPAAWMLPWATTV